ncbi:hypothetical protein CEUSTIGMA_g14016.t1 [Chlamydomonas eustigma]|uniref:Uncharacterized protein n=1 Tax=Chlamydomonas eustigma TaxID=1157962 RepID=A0A250XU81_9CHLO|nr:hypothetical protein CEUSTIGMA_g14016.t1 [Chlamydomonas eustigma]|eukprot:GAX86608.1 hypothetical protein CEUSTIGMA_g14016.t1 [Chlamydomonas eustigma]
MAVMTRRSNTVSTKTTRVAGRRMLTVRATGNDMNSEPKPEATTTGAAPSAPAPPPPAPKPVTPPSLQSAMAFSGPAPETINGRLAMLGFIAAVGAELSSGSPLLSQLDSSVGPVLLTLGVFSVASLVPILNGANLKEAFGPFKPEAELLNGRLAMLGLVALVATEGVKGSALF